MVRRGDVLRDHILDTAKESFLETGFERTSMDAVAVRAATSKRSLYAHFPTKQALFLAVVDHIDELFQGRMRTPETYSEEPVEAVALYCARFRQMLSWESGVQTCRLGITVASQFPQAATQLHEVFFHAPAVRLSSYLEGHLGLQATEADDVAERILGVTVFQRTLGLLFGVTPSTPDLPATPEIADAADVAFIRQTFEVTLPKSVS